MHTATLAQHSELYSAVRKSTRDRKAAAHTARHDQAIAKAEAVAMKLLKDSRRLTPRNAKGEGEGEGAYFYPSAVEWTVLALIRIGLGDRSVMDPSAAIRMREVFLRKIEAAARRVRAAFGETQEKPQLDYRSYQPHRAAPGTKQNGCWSDPAAVLRFESALRPSAPGSAISWRGLR